MVSNTSFVQAATVSETEVENSKLTITLSDNDGNKVDQLIVPVQETIISGRERSSTMEHQQSNEVLICVNQDTGKISQVDSVPIVSRSSQQANENNVYWKATITWTQTGDKVVLSKVEGGWIQLRGSATLSDRCVNYGVSRIGANSSVRYSMSGLSNTLTVQSDKYF